ncbi:MAG: S8 family serine peptidase [Candidatus Nitrosopolaris sp.]
MAKDPHGMCCAGIASALANNPSGVMNETEGIAGAAPNCQVMGVMRPLAGTETEYADVFYWIAGFDPPSTLGPPDTGFPAKITPGADIITCSWGPLSSALPGGVGMPISNTMKACFDYLTTNGRNGKGVVLFFSAGNENMYMGDPQSSGLPGYDRPWAAYQTNIAVAASTNGVVGEKRAGYSNFGIELSVCAPSSDSVTPPPPPPPPPPPLTSDQQKNFITTCYLPGMGDLPGYNEGTLGDYIDSFGGTSASTPLVAGVAALLLSANPQLTWSQVKQILTNSAVKIDVDNTDPVGIWKDINGKKSTDPGYLSPNFSEWYGFGRIDAFKAILMVLPQQITTVDVTCLGTTGNLTVNVSGINFTPNNTIQIYSKPSTHGLGPPPPPQLVATNMTDSQGKFQVSFTYPDLGPNADFELIAKDASGRISRSSFGGLGCT